MTGHPRRFAALAGLVVMLTLLVPTVGHGSLLSFFDNWTQAGRVRKYIRDTLGVVEVANLSTSTVNALLDTEYLPSAAGVSYFQLVGLLIKGDKIRQALDEQRYDDALYTGLNAGFQSALGGVLQQVGLAGVATIAQAGTAPILYGLDTFLQQVKRNQVRAHLHAYFILREAGFSHEDILSRRESSPLVAEVAYTDEGWIYQIACDPPACPLGHFDTNGRVLGASPVDFYNMTKALWDAAGAASAYRHDKDAVGQGIRDLVAAATCDAAGAPQEGTPCTPGREQVCGSWQCSKGLVKCVRDSSREPSLEICDDGIDNDCNGRTDCRDTACTLNPICLPCTNECAVGTRCVFIGGSYYQQGCDSGNDSDSCLEWGGNILCPDGCSGDTCDAATTTTTVTTTLPTTTSTTLASTTTTLPTGGSMGCADGQREGFVDGSTYPDIAGCSGGWSVPGIHTQNPGSDPECGLYTFDTVTPTCARAAGDDGSNPSGTGCDVADLCAEGWHVCDSAADVAAGSPTGCVGATTEADPPLFFATRQTGTGCGVCATGAGTEANCTGSTCAAACLQTAATANDLFGCGNLGSPGYYNTGLVDCAPLELYSGDSCWALEAPWSCSSPSGFCEAYAVTKSDPTRGGVLCCRGIRQPPPPPTTNRVADSRGTGCDAPWTGGPLQGLYSAEFGQNGSYIGYDQVIVPTISGDVDTITVSLVPVAGAGGPPTDGVTLELWTYSGILSAPLGVLLRSATTSADAIAAAGASVYDRNPAHFANFSFSSVHLDAGVEYYLHYYRTGTSITGEYYRANMCLNETYPGGFLVWHGPGDTVYTRDAATFDLFFQMLGANP